MTAKQRKIFDFIEYFIEENGYSPTFQQIADKMKLRSLATVSKHIDRIIAEGYLTKKDKAKNGLSIPKNKRGVCCDCYVQAQVIAETLDHIDTRCMASDGPVTPTLQEATNKELRMIYRAADKIRRRIER